MLTTIWEPAVAAFCRRLRALSDTLADALDGALGQEGGAPIVTAGGSAYFDVVTRELTADGTAPVQVILRSGAYLTHDHGFYDTISPAGRGAAGAPALRPAIEVWAQVLSRPEPGLADREALTLTLEYVLGGHPHVGELDFGVALSVHVAEHRQAAQHGDPGRVDGDDHHRLLTVRRGGCSQGARHLPDAARPVAKRRQLWHSGQTARGRGAAWHGRDRWTTPIPGISQRRLCNLDNQRFDIPALVLAELAVRPTDDASANAVLRNTVRGR